MNWQLRKEQEKEKMQRPQRLGNGGPSEMTLTPEELDLVRDALQYYSANLPDDYLWAGVIEAADKLRNRLEKEQ